MKQVHNFYLFINEILIQLDKGESIPISVIEQAFDSGSICNSFHQKFGFKNINSSLEEFKFIDEFMGEAYVSENEAYNRGFDNNGLTYLVNIALESLNRYNSEYN